MPINIEKPVLVTPENANEFDGGGRPPYDGGMDARLTAIETMLPTLMTKTDGAELRVEMQKIAGETHKWMLATVIGLFLGFGGLFLAMSNALKQPSQPAAQQPPIIINVPAAVAPAAPTSK